MSPTRQHLAACEVLLAVKRDAAFYLDLRPIQILILAMLGGAFIIFGVLFSVLLSTGMTASGPQLPLQGLGFSTVFCMIILSRAGLFTEANVILPASLLQMS